MVIFVNQVNIYLKIKTQMSNSENSGCFGVLTIVIYALAWIGTGIIAWNWIKPNSFGRAILFILAWSIFGYITQIIGGLIIAGIAKLME